ncbi:protein AMN1 homolog [Montipora capricornis]|uniref:protein AMN1 homolog n=1 Tax=Montipora capricornis TaxID=246305 RepID=UPI0035F19C5F
MAVFGTVGSLQNHCLRAVACQLPDHETSLYELPVEIKTKLVHLLSKRGLLTDTNITMVLHPALRDLELCECRISDNGLRSLCICKNLRKLDLNATKNPRDDITSEGIIGVFTSCSQLQTVYLRRCVNITDVAIAALTEHCTHLEHLNLCGCVNVTDVSLHLLAKNCRFLRSLNISKTKVTDDGVMQLTTGKCQQSIKEVQVSHCIHITDVSIEALLARCPRINILIFDGCPHVTDNSRQAIEEAGQLKQLSWTIY